jgi:hypothetical protein
VLSHSVVDNVDIGENIRNDYCKISKYKAPKLLHMRKHGLLAL